MNHVNMQRTQYSKKVILIKHDIVACSCVREREQKCAQTKLVPQTECLTLFKMRSKRGTN